MLQGDAVSHEKWVDVIRYWREALAGGLAAVLVAVAFVVPYLGNELITPIINRTPQQVRDFADAAPLFGFREPHYGWGTPFAIVVAIAGVLWGPELARRLPWRRLLFVVWGSSAAWTMSLAMIDGWRRGFVDRLASTDEYLHEVPGITDIPETLRGFSDRILDYQVDSWTTHVSGHPPGALLTFVWLDRLGLSGGAWAASLCVLVGTSAAAAVLVTVRALGDETMARRAAPFVVLAPAAIWVAVSADAFYMGVVAWGIALLAVSTRKNSRLLWPASVAAGVLLGFGIYLNYGLVLMGLPAVAVLIAARTAWPLVGAVAGALVVTAVFTAYGFWWFDGYELVQERYYQGIATDRPFAYWGWANFAALFCALGLAVPAALPRIFTRLQPINLLVLAGLAAVVMADLSQLSKAETERIWLPFAMWMLLAPAVLPQRSHKFWLALQVVAALAINHLLFTNW
ncbi:hypothetical protein CH289_06360 [Rhodococcus sp. RS1C4]|uniref:hypothetical protein n=1 Tax=Nocardiaceae TaxID=85025 RepID=UPI00055CD6CF|nr:MULTISPECIES: hypothetical protein [Rhodococcus]OZC56336.1 hypothetical protein CH289_06360 [Rhodococcus sp. RS1C4]OZC60390.1 hypothetical protein CH267_05485 [Rhodococcus sp. 06-621-2]OZD58550.1 hypothetical protein CH263_25220 [Rhodococcus sp. 06-1059B-a]OZE85063.1 hypothetical protein CH304_07895 [Rhodococcus sp. 15-649-1-2]OZF50527.1 hypothetical protein CH292_12670 [Rhodococcus sp. 14-2470-1a]